MNSAIAWALRVIPRGYTVDGLPRAPSFPDGLDQDTSRNALVVSRLFPEKSFSRAKIFCDTKNLILARENAIARQGPSESVSDALSRQGPSESVWGRLARHMSIKSADVD